MVARFGLKGILTVSWCAFPRPFTPVAWHFLALTCLIPQLADWAKVDTAYGILSTKMKKHIEVSAERQR